MATDYYMPFMTGDYLRDTRHLSLNEHGAYILLLCHYWDKKAPLVSDSVSLYRIAGAVSDEERAAVESVLAQFFKKSAGCYHNKKMDSLIAKKAANSANGQRGGRPRKNPDTNPNKSEYESQGKSQNESETESETESQNKAPDPEPSHNHGGISYEIPTNQSESQGNSAAAPALAQSVEQMQAAEIASWGQQVFTSKCPWFTNQDAHANGYLIGKAEALLLSGTKPQAIRDTWLKACEKGKEQQVQNFGWFRTVFEGEIGKWKPGAVAAQAVAKKPHWQILVEAQTIRNVWNGVEASGADFQLCQGRGLPGYLEHKQNPEITILADDYEPVK